MSKEEFLSSLDKQKILLGISRYLEEHRGEIPDNVSPEDVWYKIVVIYLKETSNSKYGKEYE